VPADPEDARPLLPADSPPAPDSVTAIPSFAFPQKGQDAALENEQDAAPFPRSADSSVEFDGEFPEEPQSEQERRMRANAFGASPVGPDPWFLSRYDQGTLAGLLLVTALAMIGWSTFQVTMLRTRFIDIDRARRSELRFEVDLNTAPAAELANLPGVGPKLAAAIVLYRKENGSFSAAEQLLNVNGIGEAKLKGILPFLRRLDETNGELAPK
jgi:competence ComEA-like helix-hairpin-helix protein